MVLPIRMLIAQSTCTFQLAQALLPQPFFINTNKSGNVSLYRILVDCYCTNYSHSFLSQLVVVSKTRFNASFAVDLSMRELKL